ncbi:uncharacterized protein AB675_3518 [Cyphellophora attinorum]|uniref:Uncharacterized protein n=1 Tax=Cyphellophora attinorum TaxID=1664694 RepID=A0A0N0NLP4_9EURO|nr:uncharacterized protein AB675_3518 [Phialophora attinorum]KPI39541.1 hypothetical protein AB675_3518 [Phialophora attinorum]
MSSEQPAEDSGESAPTLTKIPNYPEAFITRGEAQVESLKQASRPSAMMLGNILMMAQTQIALSKLNSGVGAQAAREVSDSRLRVQTSLKHLKDIVATVSKESQDMFALSQADIDRANAGAREFVASCDVDVNNKVADEPEKRLVVYAELLKFSAVMFEMNVARFIARVRK